MNRTGDFTFYGGGSAPVGAPVFKIGEWSRAASAGGFDSHPLPLSGRRTLHSFSPSLYGLLLNR